MAHKPTLQKHPKKRDSTRSLINLPNAVLCLLRQAWPILRTRRLKFTQNVYKDFASVCSSPRSSSSSSSSPSSSSSSSSSLSSSSSPSSSSSSRGWGLDLSEELISWLRMMLYRLPKKRKKTKKHRIIAWEYVYSRRKIVDLPNALPFHHRFKDPWSKCWNHDFLVASLFRSIQEPVPAHQLYIKSISWFYPQEGCLSHIHSLRFLSATFQIGPCGVSMFQTVFIKDFCNLSVFPTSISRQIAIFSSSSEFRVWKAI